MGVGGGMNLVPLKKSGPKRVSKPAPGETFKWRKHAADEKANITGKKKKRSEGEEVYCRSKV